MKVSDYIVSYLADRGITDVFGYPGGMVTHLMDSFAKSDRVSAHISYHEQGAAFCACGYAQVSLRPGCAYATSGPGATNLVTGIANAFFDSIPCIFLCGQVNTYESKGDLKVRQKGFQETDIVSIVQSVTKYSYRLVSEKEIRYCMEKAYYSCTEGRPGPVLLDIPMNILRQDIKPELLNGFIPSVQNSYDIEALCGSVLSHLSQAKRPCILAGAGIQIAGATDAFRALVGKLKIPVVTSMIAVDVIPHDSPYYYGFIGSYGDRKANFITNKSDLLLSFGSRLDIRQIGADAQYFAPTAKLIRFEIDENELTNTVKSNEIQIAAPLKDSIVWLEKHADAVTDKYSTWNGICNYISEKLSGIDYTEPNCMVKEISRQIPDYYVITTDVGQNQVWVSQSFETKTHQRILFSGGLGAMGYSLPASIGAYYASRRPVVSISGDGGMQMNLQELQFIAREHLPIKIILLNNNALGMIRHFQEMYFDGLYTQTTEDNGYSTPSFQKIAYAYGISYYLVEKPSDIPTEAIRGTDPVIIEVKLTGNTYVFPKLAMNKPTYDQEPLLERTLYNELLAL